VRDEEGNIYSFVRSLSRPNGNAQSDQVSSIKPTMIEWQHLRMDHERMAAQAPTPIPVQTPGRADICLWTNQP